MMMGMRRRERRMLVVLDARDGKGGAGHRIELLLLGVAVSAPDQRRGNLGMHALRRTCKQTHNSCLLCFLTHTRQSTRTLKACLHYI